MNAVYVVIGETGQYADFAEWNVAAYADSSLAHEHARRANEWAREHFKHANESGNFWRYLDDKKNPFDSEMKMDSNGTQYQVATVPLLSEIPNETEKETRK